MIAALHRLSVGDFAPDLTIVLDLPVDAGLARAQGRGMTDRYERLPAAFHEAVRARFLAIAAADPARCRVIDASADVATVHARVREALGPC